MNAAVYHKKLARVLDRMGGLYTVSDILKNISCGRMQSFVENNSWAITQIVDFPRKRVLEIFAVIGDLEDLRVLHDRIIEYAADLPADVVVAYGRKGWLPDAKRRGWRIKARSFVYQRDMQ